MTGDIHGVIQCDPSMSNLSGPPHPNHFAANATKSKIRTHRGAMSRSNGGALLCADPRGLSYPSQTERDN